VPLLMALRLATVRLLIADDVGIGKTIEAGLIARELLDRGEVKRIAVLCPPQLCDQWQRELKKKFHIDAVVVRSGTIAKLERGLPTGDHHVFSYYPHLVVSLDYAKSDRRRASFLTHCPDLIIVDEAHTCANSGNTTQQQRHQLIAQIAERPEQHFLLLTATPHSGIEASFLSLLGLLRPQFGTWSLDSLTSEQRTELARHFVQRRRADVQQWLGDTTPFPERETLEQAYSLSKDYWALFDTVYDFARGLVNTEEASLSHAQRRGRYWSALAIIRCVMSSPAAAIATLSQQIRKREAENSPADPEELGVLEELAAAYVYDPTEQEQVLDVVPSVIVEKGQQSYNDAEKRKLRTFVKQAEALQGKGDQKLQTTIALVKDLLAQGLNPIIWCRYIATAKYVTEQLQNAVEKKRGSTVRAIAITGEQSEDEREIRLQELKSYPQRVMVATDCLSEGVNLQEHFTAVIHYDLPWNPNRLEQREGRVDRYGQVAPVVKCILLYGQDNPVDGAVLDVLIRKAVTIHRTLGITVPVPMDSNTVQNAIFQSLFDYDRTGRQTNIFEVLNDTGSPASLVQKNWDRAVEKERLNRTKFAQRTIKPEDVQQELLESDHILGREADVQAFVIAACARLSATLQKRKQGWYLPHIPPCLASRLGTSPRQITFTTPVPEGVEYIGRNHPLVEGLAQYLLGTALEGSAEPVAARCGFTVTNAVKKPTLILLLRLRHLLTATRRHVAQSPLLTEECLVAGFTGKPSEPQWLSTDAAIALFETVEPSGDLPPIMQQERLERYLAAIPHWQPHLETLARDRAATLKDSHSRVRKLTQEEQVKVEPQLPMDILGVYVLWPG
jgi:superfamily II DNA or RNA helicase